MKREELVHAMMSAFRDGVIGSATEQREDFKGMSAALDVAVGELLKEFTNVEFYAATNEPNDFRMDRDGKRFASAFGIAQILASRRAQIEKVKTPEERVTVGHLGELPGGWGVYLDNVLKFGASGIAKCNAEIYRIGLIAKLKEESK